MTLMLVGVTPSGRPLIFSATSTGPYFLPRVAVSSGASVIVTGRVYFCLTTLASSPSAAGRVTVSVTGTMKVPGLVGVPERVPSSAKVNPSGRFSAVNFAVAPSGSVSWILFSYSSPTEPGSMDLGDTTMESAATTLPSTSSSTRMVCGSSMSAGISNEHSSALAVSVKPSQAFSSRPRSSRQTTRTGLVSSKTRVTSMSAFWPGRATPLASSPSSLTILISSMKRTATGRCELYQPGRPSGFFTAPEVFWFSGWKRFAP